MINGPTGEQCTVCSYMATLSALLAAISTTAEPELLCQVLCFIGN
jgi:hypothetical protein